MTKYRVHFVDGTKVEIEAEVLNLGMKKLWLYDGERNLLAVFVWERILGFEVAGSVAGQRFTDDLLHEKKAQDDARLSKIAEKGELWMVLQEASETVDRTTAHLSRAWLQLHEWQTSKPTETGVIVQRQRAELQQIEARFMDQQKRLNTNMQTILDELTKLLSKQT